MGSGTWRKAYGALNDSTKVGLTNLTASTRNFGSLQDLDIAIVKATNHVECPPKGRHFRSVDKIIDLATLTGACVLALGPSIAEIFTPSDELAQEVTAASELSGEKFWRLPMEESYSEQMKSGVADMVNTGGRQGGSITAALFLYSKCLEH
ncbi:hypothetical protein ZWY2020_041363 [Hordeum vulgare]|nr:hypothetical protein ZWY2020_041363 [Hordeum vulgare]